VSILINASQEKTCRARKVYNDLASSALLKLHLFSLEMMLTMHRC